MTDHPEVKAAVALALGDPRGERRLVAYVVPREPIVEDQALVVGDQEVLTDPFARFQFKLEKRGLRPPEPDRPSFPLAGAPTDEASRAARLQRRTVRRFLPEPVPLESLGRLLAPLVPIEIEGSPFPKYGYASAGGVYPVQTWVFVHPGRGGELDPGLYYHDPSTHRLRAISADARIARGDHADANRLVFDEAAFTILLVGRIDAIAPLYGREAGREFCMIEAGAISHVLMAEATPLGLGLCQIGWFDATRIGPHLGVGPDVVVLHSLLGGLADSRRDFAARGEIPSPSSSVSAGPAPGAGRTRAELSSALRHHLARKVPEPLVPSAFVFVDSFPLSPTGKVDRRALAASQPSAVAAAEPSVPPRDETEKRLAAIVEGLLGIQGVGARDRLGDLGASSIHVVRLQARIRETFGCQIPIPDMFRHPTIEGLAALVERAGRDAPPPPESSALERIEQLSDEEVDALLRREVAGAPEATRDGRRRAGDPSAEDGTGEEQR